MLEVIDSIEEMSGKANQWSYSDKVALVPTMGFLHEGHLSLVRAAAQQSDKVVVSIFVNPLQFGESEDLGNYPRSLERDAKMLHGAGANIVFTPNSAEITPEDMEVVITPGRMGDVLCGKYRPGHFQGVCTIVAKLFQIIRPGLAVFGWKDAQQFLILKKMVCDLNIPVKMDALETRREPGGLAMSSRNSYLSAAEAKAAVALFDGLSAADRAYRTGNNNDADALAGIVRERIKQEPLLKTQYVETVSMDRLQGLKKIESGNTLLAVAVLAGKTRLIDNIRL